jgi:hypothetical protein
LAEPTEFYFCGWYTGWLVLEIFFLTAFLSERSSEGDLKILFTELDDSGFRSFSI